MTDTYIVAAVRSPIGKFGGALVDVSPVDLAAHVMQHALTRAGVPGDALPEWYAAAEVFLYPSLFEGFGLPVMEAMASGTPVICSQAPGVGEVAGDAAVTFPPHDEDALVRAMHLVISQPELRGALSRRGVERAARFSWRCCAQQTLAVYLRVFANL